MRRCLMGLSLRLHSTQTESKVMKPKNSKSLRQQLVIKMAKGFYKVTKRLGNETRNKKECWWTGNWMLIFSFHVFTWNNICRRN